MYRVYFFVLVAGLLLCISLRAQQKNTAATVPYWSFNEVGGFPVITGANKSAAFRINCFLQANMLNKMLLPSDTNAFNSLLYDQSFYGYEVQRNDLNCVSIRFNWEGCGAYCEDFSVYHTFDSHTGELVTAKDIFTRDGYLSVKQAIASERRETIIREIEFEKGMLENMRKGVETIADETDSLILVDQISLYQDCLERRDTTYFEYNQMYMTDSLVWFIAERCSNHAMRAIDDLYEFYNSWRVYYHVNSLSEYGKQLFGLGNPTVIPKRFKIFEGTINGKYPILFFENLIPEGNQFTYCYTKYGTIIPLEITSQSEVIELEETDSDSATTGTFILTKSANGFSGSYFNLSSGKSMSFDVKEKL